MGSVLLTRLILAAVLGLLQDPSNDPVTQLYDVTDLLMNHDQSDDGLRVLPYDEGSGTSQGMYVGESTDGQVIDEMSLISLIRQCVCPNTWGRGGQIVSPNGLDGYLLVLATPDIHARIDRFLEVLRRRLAVPIVLELRVLACQDLPREAQAMSVVDADRRIAELTAAGAMRLARAVTAGVPEGLVTRAAAVDVDHAVSDWDVEIAQAGVIFQPITHQFETGLTVVARAARAPGGTLLDLAVRYSEQMVPPFRRDIEGLETIRTEQGVDRFGVPLAVEHPRMAFVSFAGSVLVADGQAVWIPCRFQGESGGLECVLDLRVPGQPGGTIGTCDLGPAAGHEDSRFLALLSVCATLSAGVGMTELGFDCFERLPWLETPLSVVTVDGALVSDPAVLESFCRQLAPDLMADQRFRFVPLARHVAVTYPQALEKSVSTTLARLAADPQPVLVSGRLLAGEDNVVAEFVVPAVIGRPLTIWSGTQVNLLRDWDVDVANDASIPNPNFGASVDGYGIRLDLEHRGQGELLVRARGRVNLHRGELITEEGGGHQNPLMERYRVESFSFDDARAAPFEAATPVLRWGGANLRLELSVARP